MATPLTWDFAPRSVNFSLTVRAVFHPSVEATSVSLPWLDASGALTPAAAPIGPFSTFEVEASEGAQLSRNSKGAARWPNAVCASCQKDLGSLAVTEELVRAFQREVLPISVLLGGDVPDAQCGGAACLHLAPLLMATDRPVEVAAIAMDTIGMAGLHKLDVIITTDMPVLDEEMLQALMPICITVETVRGFPNEPWLPELCEDVYVEVCPQFTTRATSCVAAECSRKKTARRAHNTMARYAEPVVWFLGPLPTHAVREWLHNESLVIEVHDRDLRLPKETEDADVEEKPQEKKHMHGIATFKLAPLLEARSRQLALRADVYPARGNKKRLRAEAQLGGGLRVEGLLGEEGKKIIRDAMDNDKLEVAPDYLDAGTCCTIRAALAVQIPKADHIQRGDEYKQQEEWAGREEREEPSEEGVTSNIWVARAPSEEGGKSKHRAKITLESGEEVLGPWRCKREEAEDDNIQLTAALGEPVEGEAQDPERAHALSKTLSAFPSTGIERRYERYGRAVFVVNDRDTPVIKAILQTMRRRNGLELGIDPQSAEMLTRLFSDEERADPHLDVLTGFSLLDGNMRLMIIEGLRDRGLKEVLEAVPRDERPNGGGYKLLYNPEIGFSERLYADFGPKLKQLKIRMPLEDLASRPELYSITGNIPEDTLNGMSVPATLMMIKSMDRFMPLRNGNAFPKSSHLEQLEILYGDYISDDMMEGEPTGSPPRKAQKSAQSASSKGSRTSPKRGTIGASPKDVGRKQLPRSTLTVSPTEKDFLESVVTLDATLDLSMCSLPQVPERRPDLDMTNAAYEKTLTKRMTASAPNLARTNKQKVKQRSEENSRINAILGKRQKRQTPFLDGKQVHLYSQQKLCSSELQKEWMREAMIGEKDSKVWTFAPAYLSQNFEFTKEDVPGVKSHHPRCPNDSYARVPGDERPVWRSTPARPREEFRKPARDVGHARPEELHEAFVENEWQRLPLCEDRHKPLSVSVRYEPDAKKIPHFRKTTERPFDRAQITVKGGQFGPKSENESVHYHGHGAPGEDRHSQVAGYNETLRKAEEDKIRGDKGMKTYSQGMSRHCVTDTDRYEMLLKDAPTQILRGSGVDDPLPSTIRIFEPYHDTGRPDLEWQARLRENDTSAPYDVNTGGYLPRDRNIGQKKATMSGRLGKAPWRHGGEDETNRPKDFEYISQHDFSVTRRPGKAKHREDHVWKNASRTSISQAERSHVNYRRPVDFGVSLSTS